MTDRVLFIDVDGPLIPARALFLNANQAPRSPWAFDPCAVGMLNFLFWALPDLRAVISSHRVGCSSPLGFEDVLTFERSFWERIFTHNGLNAPLHDAWITPRQLEARPKIMEISDWLNGHPEVTRFAVLEDELNGHEEMTAGLQRQFNVFAQSYADGLTYDCFFSAAKALGLQGQEVKEKFKQYLQLRS